jgi:transcriptional regulator with XRE-family HTH domain
MARKFSKLTKNFSPERRAQIEAKKEQLRLEMDLVELHHALELTQSTLAETLNVGQAEISKIENRADIDVSTLRKFIQAMGGELEINAVFADRSIRIKSFSSLAEQPRSEVRSVSPQEQENHHLIPGIYLGKAANPGFNRSASKSH